MKFDDARAPMATRLIRTSHTALTFTDYKVADLSLADWGRKEIELAEVEMPGPHGVP